MGVNWELTFPITWQSQGWIKSWNYLWLNSVLNVTKKYSTRVEYERTNNMMSITVPSPDSHIPGPNSSPIFQFKFPSLASSGGLRNVYRNPPISGYPEPRGENLKKENRKVREKKENTLSAKKPTKKPLSCFLVFSLSCFLLLIPTSDRRYPPVIQQT